MNAIIQFRKTNSVSVCKQAPAQSCTDVQAFIASTFARHYNATIEKYCDHLLCIRDAADLPCAAAGYNLAEDGPLFLEQYLDVQLEMHVSQHLGMDILRTEIAEVGNLAARSAGGARMLIELLTQHLYEEGRRWVTFTATRSLINSFHKLGLSPVILAPALPERVSNPAAWGTYYLQKPFVAIGDIHLGYSQLGSRQ